MAVAVPPAQENQLENGRLYHGWRRGLYMFPCDEVRLAALLNRASETCLLPSPSPHQNPARGAAGRGADSVAQDEKDRMDLYHKLFEVARKGQLHQAPIANNPYEPPRILDLGCGTGIWAIDMAE